LPGKPTKTRPPTEAARLFFFAFIQLHYERKHVARQVLYNFTARRQLLSDRRAHDIPPSPFRVRQSIRLIA
jgi:hypothetical protein